MPVRRNLPQLGGEHFSLICDNLSDVRKAQAQLMRPGRRWSLLTALAVTMVAVLFAWLAFAVSQPARADNGCNSAANPIVCENALTGTDPGVWDIDGAGDDSSQGFSTDMSVAPTWPAKCGTSMRAIGSSAINSTTAPG